MFVVNFAIVREVYMCSIKQEGFLLSEYIFILKNCPDDFDEMGSSFFKVSENELVRIKI